MLTINRQTKFPVELFGHFSPKFSSQVDIVTDYGKFLPEFFAFFYAFSEGYSPSTRPRTTIHLENEIEYHLFLWMRCEV
ncbi:hypothetical protein Y032_0111g253 [Ancylostoma ceylanicum]|uniref:Uncharacterized protein n=1 Tax=Ancylostoma ceylanicum TaxID=53326 RepID=A0A016TEH7_9BILA|nr:hypothetical protein Y032_0111g253 [Ancylostoma ceylanicum]